MQYSFIHATDAATLTKIFRFRYEVLCEELNVIAPNQDKTETDIYDDHALHFAALDEHARICAVVRVIHHSPVGYPTEHFCDVGEKVPVCPREKVAELSRIFIAPSYRNLRYSRHIIRGLLLQSVYPRLKNLGIDYCYGSLEKAFIKMLNMIGIPYRAIGEGSEYNGAIRYPSLLCIEELEQLNGLQREEKHHKHITCGANSIRS